MRTLRSLALLFAVVLFIPAEVGAAVLVNINTADSATLQTLPGIGATKAQAIIDYRTGHGPFATIADIQNVSGIGPSTYAQIAGLITVGETSPSPDTSSATSTAPTSSTSTPSTTQGGGGAVHTPPPALRIDIGGARHVSVHTPIAFEATVMVPSGALDTQARVTWAFGNGASGEGYAAETVYDYPGTYLVAAKASDGKASARTRVAVTVETASVRIAALMPDGLMLENGGAEDLDLSGWVLARGATNFRIPEGTWVAPHTAVFFPSWATKLGVAESAVLAYPDGSIASAYPSATTVLAPVQPPAPAPGYTRVQTTVPALTSFIFTSHDTTLPAGIHAGGVAVSGPRSSRTRDWPPPSLSTLLATARRGSPLL